MAILELGSQRAHEAGAGGHRTQHRRARGAGRTGGRQGGVHGGAAGEQEGGQALARVAAGAQFGHDEAGDPGVAAGERVVDQIGRDRGHAGEAGVDGKAVELLPAGRDGLRARVGEQAVEVGLGEALEAGDGGVRQSGERAPDDPPPAEAGNGRGAGGRWHDKEHNE